MSKSKKVTWDDWKQKVGWNRKTHIQRAEIFNKISSTKRIQGIWLMRDEKEIRLRDFSVEQRMKNDISDSDHEKMVEKFWEKLEEEGIYRSCSFEQSFDRDDRIVYGKTKCDPPPLLGSPSSDRFLRSLGDDGKLVWERFNHIESKFKSLRKKWADALDGGGEALSKDEEKQLAGLRKEFKRVETEYRRLWIKSKNAGVYHPDVEAAKVHKAIKEAPTIWISKEEAAQYKGGLCIALTSENIAQQKQEHEERVKEHEAAIERLKKRDEDASREFGEEGKKAAIANIKRKKAAEKAFKAQRNAPRVEALNAFLGQEPNGTLPEAARYLERAKVVQSEGAGNTWLKRIVKEGLVAPFRPVKARSKKTKGG